MIAAMTRNYAFIAEILFISTLLSGCYRSSLKGETQDSGIDGAVYGDEGAPDGNVHLDDSQDLNQERQDDRIHGEMYLELDLPEIGEDAAVLEPAGPQVVVDDETQTGGTPTVAWTDSEWGVAWGDDLNPVIFRPLDAMANPLGSPVEVSPSLDGLNVALDWGPGLYGLAASTRISDIGVGMIDHLGNLVYDILWIPSGKNKDPDLAWSRHVDGFLVVYASTEGNEGENLIYAALIGGSGYFMRDPTIAGTGRGSHGPRAITLTSRLAVAWLSDEGVWYRTFMWSEPSLWPLPQLILPMGAAPDSYIEAKGYRDYAVIAAMDGADVVVVVMRTLDGQHHRRPHGRRSFRHREQETRDCRRDLPPISRDLL